MQAKSPPVQVSIKKIFNKAINSLIYFSFYEQIWGCFFLFFSIIGALMLKNVIEFLTNPEYNSIAVASLSDFYIVIPVCALTWIARDLFSYLMKDILRANLDETRFKSEKEKNDRSLLLCKWTVDFFLYLFTSITTFFILKNQHFFPPILFGKGDPYQIQTPDFPNIYRTPYLREMYCFQLGIHLYSFLYQIIKKRNDKKYFEFALHHIMALSLIFYSYTSNYMNSGIMVLLTHDFSDAFLVLARGYPDLRFKKKGFVNLIYVTTFSVWCYCRLYAFPNTVIWANIFLRNNVQQKYKALFDYVNVYMVSMTIVLYIMNSYWTLFLIKAQITSYFTNRLTVDYDEKDREKKTIPPLN